ncbi:MAG: PP2C family serine/threonine-protein phosphatase [Bacteroidales bacterium]
MYLKVAGISDKGIRRSQNEDHILLDDQLFTDDFREVSFKDNTLQAVFAVADGIGGHRAGEVASEEVLKDLFRFTEQFSNDLEFEEVKAEFSRWIKSTHEHLNKMSVENPSYEGMGTTLTGVFYYSAKFISFHTGDSRLYIFSKGKLKQLTTDHTLAWLTNDPTIPSNYIANSVGGGKIPFVDVHDLTSILKTGDLLLICSDGLTDMITDGELEQLLVKPDARKIIEQVYEKGARDNVSLLTMEIL